MNTQFWIVQAFNGLSYGALLFLVGAGLSLIFGVMRIVNLSHGSYFLLGGYVALSVIHATGSWALSLPVAALTIAALGIAMERLFLRSEGFEYLRNAALALGLGILVALAMQSWKPNIVGSRMEFFVVAAIATIVLYFLLTRISVVAIETDVLRQVLLTVGFAFLFQQAALDIWGGNNMDIVPPAELTRSIVVGGIYLPLYRVFMIGTAVAIGIVLWLAMEKTRMGAAVRATVDDAQMARGVGIDTNRISMFIFALGAFLAALGGVIGGAFLGIYPGLDFEMLPLAFAVVIIGGMGSLGGAALAALFGLFAIRAGGVYFLMITLALGQCVWGLAYRWNSLTGGDNGINMTGRPNFGLDLTNEVTFFYLVFAFFAVSMVLMYVLVRSPFGQSLAGIRERELRMQILGYNTWLHKYIAFIIAGGFGGLSGVLWAHTNGHVSPETVVLTTSVDALLMVVLGGAGTLVGATIGTSIVFGLREYLSTLVPWWQYVLGAVYVLTILYLPMGLMGLLPLVRQRLKPKDKEENLKKLATKPS
jgi:ABC-type branched-subunit amino acid transport system permease subunit